VQDAVRVGLVHLVAVYGRDDVVFIGTPYPNAFDEAFPYAGRTPGFQGVGGFIPAVKLTHHANGRGVRRPNGKIDAPPALVFDRVGAQLLVGLEKRPFVKKIHIEIGQERYVVPHGMIGSGLFHHVCTP
jgi:hypothetical protein